MRDESPERAWITKDVEIHSGSVSGDCLHENRTALAAIRQEPAPKVGTLAEAPDRPPSTAKKREVEEDDRVRFMQSDIDNVIRPEIAVHDPSLVFDKKLPLDGHPLITRFCDKSWLPEKLVQLDDGKPRDFTQAHRQGRLSGRSTTEDDHSLHILQKLTKL